MFKKDTYLYEEAEFLLRYELRDLSSYNSILKAIASGYSTLNEIAQKSYIAKNAIIKYFDTLSGLDLIHNEQPYLSGKKDKLKERNSLYFIKDNYFNFYYNFIYPFKEEINLGHISEVVDYFNKNFNAYLEFIFENISKQFLIDRFKINFARQWGNYKTKENNKLINKSYEIDLLNVNQEKKEIIVFEVKWKDLDYKKSLKIIKELENKINYLPINLEKYKIKIGIVAKSVKYKQKLTKQGFLVFDLVNM